MNRRKWLNNRMAILVLVLAVASTAAGQVIYVDADANGADDGTSWGDAYNYLQDGLAAAVDGNDIRVAEGTYTPDSSSADPNGSGDPTATFQLINGVAIYGGYAGFGEPDPNARDVQLYETILSGELNGDDEPDPGGGSAGENCSEAGDINDGETLFDTTGSTTDGPGDCPVNQDIWYVYTAELTGYVRVSLCGSYYDTYLAVYEGTTCPPMSLLACNDDYCGLQSQVSLPVTQGTDYLIRVGGYGSNTGTGTITIRRVRAENSYHVVTGSGTDANALLEGFTITGGYANGDSLPDNRGGGMLNMSGSPTVSNCAFISNRAYGGAGGMYNNNSSPTLSYCDFNDNAAQFAGAMMNCKGSSPTLTNCTFSDNEALYALGTGYPYGGGMYNVQSSPTLSNCTFQGNSSEATGGGMHNYDTSLTLTNCIFSGNSSVETGGGMENHYSNPTVTDCNFTGNSAYIGGGMENYDTSLTLTNCIFSGNTAMYDGGAIDNQFRSNITISNCIFTGNSAAWNDGGALNNDTSSPTINNCIFSGNSAYDWGGAVRNIHSSSPTLTNCIFTGNSADEGGGVYNYDNSNPTLTNCTFSGNIATTAGGGINGCRPTLNNCVLWSDEPDGIYGSATVTYSDVQGGWSGTGNIDEDPCFMDADGLDDIFGTEDDDLRLLSASPCVDKGDNTALPADTTDMDGDGNTAEPIPFDLAGNPRIADGNNDGNPVVDMGAYEKAENSPPLACIVAGDRTVEAVSNCEARVTLDGSCSSDVDSTPATNDDINDFDWFEQIDPCDPNSDIFLGTGEIIECNLPLGEHIVALEVTDKADMSDTNEVTIFVEDTTAPIISLNGSAIVILECGVDIYTEEGATATDNCDENVEVVIGGDTVDKSTCGTYLVTYDAVDDSGNPAEQVTRTVIVEDTLPPEFNLMVSPNVLWPANHKMVEIRPCLVVGDHCDEWPDVSLVSITMNEDAETKGSGHTIGDIWVDANDGIWLRAERSGAGSGRVYTITYQAVDDSNNVTVDSAAVTVPHDMR